MNPVAQPETNKLLAEVFEYLREEKSITEFTKRRFLLAAQNQPALDREHVLSSLIYTVSGDKELAKKHAYLALKYLEQPATITNVLLSLQLNGLNVDVVDTISNHRDFLDDLEFSKAFIPFLLTFPNIDLMERVMMMLDKTNKLESYSDNLSDMMLFIQHASLANEKFGLDKRVIGNISKVAASVVSKHKNLILNCSALSLSPSGEWLSLVYYVESDNNLIADLNWELGDEIINMGLDELPIVARFEVLPSNKECLRIQYVQ